MSFIYLATPYTKYEQGIEAAFQMACRHAGEFLRLKFPVFCPIAHSHPISEYGGMSAKDHGIWMPLDFAFLDSSFALVVALEPGWQESYGVQEEIKYFKKLNKPTYYWQPPLLEADQTLIQELAMDWENFKCARYYAKTAV